MQARILGRIAEGFTAEMSTNPDTTAP